MNSVEEQVSLFDHDSWSGKTSPEHSAPTKARTSGQSSKKRQGSKTRMPLFLDLRGASGQTAEPSWVIGGPLRGVYTTRSFGESPSADVESRLSAILQDNPPPKYALSAKACLVILTRAERRGKKMPEELEAALMAQAGVSPDGTARASEFSTQAEYAQHSTAETEREEILHHPCSACKETSLLEEG